MGDGPAELDGTVPLAATVGRLERAVRSHRWTEVRSLLHDGARLESIAAGGVRGPDETVEAFRTASGDGVYSFGPTTIEELGPDAVLVSAGLRHRTQGGGVSDAVHVWLITGREGLIWRGRVFPARAQALEQLERNGPSLGLRRRATRPG